MRSKRVWRSEADTKECGQVYRSLSEMAKYAQQHQLSACMMLNQASRVLVVCTACGLYAERKAVGLAKPCRVASGLKRTARGTLNLNRIAAGRHPDERDNSRLDALESI